MPSYRLLRSNKESGPYSLNDLVTLGLKPYDLIWVEGRSAAWRYPSEVAELKDYAPAVEEQPYDRFFKKPSQTKTSTNESPAKELAEKTEEPVFVRKNQVIETSFKEESVKNEEPVKKNIPQSPNPFYPGSQPQPKKQVFVSLPEKNGFSQGINNYQQDQYQQYLPKPKPVQEPVPIPEKTNSSPIDIYEPEDTKLETKYSQSLDDIKEMYINTLVQRKTRNRRKEIIRKYLRPALVPLLLLISGVAIGYVINSKKNASQESQKASNLIPKQTTPEQKNDDQPAENKLVLPEEKQELVAEVNNKKNINNPRQRPPQTSEIESQNIRAVPKAVIPATKKKELFVPDEEVATYQKKSTTVDPVTGERKRTVRELDNDESGYQENNVNNNNWERPNKKINSGPNFLETESSNIWDLVSVKTNNYIRGAFGGIRGLELTILNKSGFLLDEVKVQLQILKPSEQPLRTDIITFRNISPRGTVTVRVPDSQRGVRVDYKITTIESKQWQKSTAGL